MGKAVPFISLMGLFTLILCIVFVIALSKIPKVIVYGMLALTFLLLCGGIAVGILLGAIPLILMFGIFGFIWTIFTIVLFCCWRNHI